MCSPQKWRQYSHDVINYNTCNNDVSYMKCNVVIQKIIFNNVFFELNTDEVTLIWPLLEGFSLNVIFSGDMIGYIREYKYPAELARRLGVRQPPRRCFSAARPLVDT